MDRNLLMWCVAGVVIGAPIGLYFAKNSQTSKVYVVQTDMLNMLEGKANKDKTLKDLVSLTEGAKDFDRCANTILEQFDNIKKVQIKLIQTGSMDINPVDIVDTYVDILKVNCK